MQSNFSDSAGYLLRLKDKLEFCYALVDLIFKTTGLQGTVVNLIDWTIHDVPLGWIKKCFCKQLLDASQDDLTEKFTQYLRDIGGSVEQFVYYCPYQHASIITPVLMDEQPIAVLITGPTLCAEPVELISNFVVPNGPYSFEELERLRSQLEMLPKADEEYLSAVSQLMLLLVEGRSIGQNVSAEKTQRVSLRSLDESCPDTIKIALEYINNNYASDISLSSVAESAYIHPTHLSKLFSKQLNVRFRDYINQLRIDEAKELLLESHKSIAEISGEVGFSDQSYFDKVFKQFEGITPKQYRRKHAGQAQNK